ncbi:uncharacterized protein LOC103389804 [Cynoglossus semilaevis]|uniref:uncharacterized protein LOC103389804 n=1 Tax=Cynoglossus semilaevis TaxID=244447 RepID=UPI000495C35A|nr:uncharacterized protein LOC103389804 [Cynoglossus semilaevis]
MKKATGVMTGEASQVRQAVMESLWGMCAADSLSMPVHWYYNIQDISKDFKGWIAGFHSPRERHPSSILTLSNTAGSGRSSSSSGTKDDDVVGDIILHDKLKLWKSSNGSVHYHQGLQAGNNTLNILCALRAAQTLACSGFTDAAHPEARAAVLSDYVQFLTTPGNHNDTYAESFHRSFFADWRESRPNLPSEVLLFAEKRAKLKLSSSQPDSQLDAIGCMPMALPFILFSTSVSEEQAVTAAVEFVKLTHPNPNVLKYMSLYGKALYAVLRGASVRQQAEHALRNLDVWDVCQEYSHKAEGFPSSSEERLKVHQSAVNHLGLACYTKGALCSLFYLAHEFHDDPKEGILTNANCGGENCNRGAALGALLGAGGSYSGVFIPDDWKKELRDAQDAIPLILKNLH